MGAVLPFLLNNPIMASSMTNTTNNPAEPYTISFLENFFILFDKYLVYSSYLNLNSVWKIK
jgi:hypothetical protein